MSDPIVNGMQTPQEDTEPSKIKLQLHRQPPEIPHVTANIVPLSNILKFYTQEAYKQLTTTIENLLGTQGNENDASRKKTFLQAIISIRQDFIKVYTLVKWAASAKDVSRLIDLLNWFRTQETFFQHLAFGLNELNQYSGAKLPNSDLITALEVLVDGRPQLPLYNLLKARKISPEKTLQVLRDLNLVLTTRMALVGDMPARFINNYRIQDGRVVFTIPNEFQVSVTVGNDLIIDTDDDYFKSPFYFIDFSFLFGTLGASTTLPKLLLAVLEKASNAILLKQGLLGLYETLHKYTISFKLYLILRQLRDLSLNSKWHSSIQFKYQLSLIIINYWATHYLLKNWKSFIELGIDKNYNLNFRWFKNGKYTGHSTASFLELYSEGQSAASSDDLSIDLLLNLIVNKHSEILVEKVYSELVGLVSDDYCSYINPHQLLLKLTPTKSAVFAINPLTGLFYFTDPSPIQNVICKRINSQPTQVKNRNFISENDMVANIVQNLIQLKLETFNKEINNKLVSTEWISNEIIKLNEYEVIKLFNFIKASDNVATNNASNKLQYYRCKNWPSSWFLINLINGLTFRTYWWVARIKSIKGEWKIQWVQKLKFEKDAVDNDEEAIVPEQELNYDFFSTLSRQCSNLIIDHMIVEELQVRKIKYLKVSLSVLQLFNLPRGEENEVASPTLYESCIILYNNDNLLPISNSSTSLFLKVKLVSVNNLTHMKLSLVGNLRNLPLENNNDFNKLNLKLYPEEKAFEIFELINLSNKINETSGTESNGKSLLLDTLFNNLNQVNQLIKILDELNKTDTVILRHSIDEIQIQLKDDFYKPVTLKLPKDEGSRITFEASEDERDEFKLMMSFLNKNLEYGQRLDKDSLIIGEIRYLHEIIPVLKTVFSVKEFFEVRNSQRLSNGVKKLTFDSKFLNLNLIQFVYNLNYANASSPKKILKDKIIIGVNFKNNKFSVEQNRILVKLSLKDNLNSKNLKYKKLFEMIFKAINDFDNAHQNDDEKKMLLIKLNYDFLLDSHFIEPLMEKISECFLTYINSEIGQT